MNTDLSAQVARALYQPYASYHEPLRLARRWNRGGDPGELAAAAALLDGLRGRYPTALRVWYEAAFNRMRRQQADEAMDLLTEMDRRFGGRLDTDTHGLFGKYYKRAGHEYLDAGLKEPLGAPARAALLERAERGYAAALAQYERGYALDRDGFPGINTAFVRFMRAVVAAQLNRPPDAERLLADARTRAREVLDAAAGWACRLPDDEVWHAATRGEAHALRGEWDEAVRGYRAATDWAGLQAHHTDSMGEQLRRVVQGTGLLAPLTAAAPSDLADRLPKLAAFLTSPSPGAV